MIVYELTHMFFRCDGEIIFSPKQLGLFLSYNDAVNAIQYYKSLPGFNVNQDAFSIQDKAVEGTIVENVVYEVLVYLHSKNYSAEAEIELGFYADEIDAQNKLWQYCKNNNTLTSTKDMDVEKIVNRCVIGRKAWIDGFSTG